MLFQREIGYGCPLGKRELIFLLSFTCNYMYMVSVGAWDRLHYFIVALTREKTSFLHMRKQRRRSASR